jgi:hypothetical protein
MLGAMGTGQPLRVRPRHGHAVDGRVVRLGDHAPERHGITLAVELDAGVCLHLADIASIGPATTRRKREHDRRNPRLAACAHAFGYRGHCLTKSQRYSTTFKALRQAREAWVHATAADAFLAASAAARADADKWVETMRRQRQLGAPLEQPDVTLDDFVLTYWELHVIPNLAQATRDSYRNVYEKHIAPRLGGRGLRELTPKVLTRFRLDLERAGVGVATVRKALAIVQSVLRFAIAEERGGRADSGAYGCQERHARLAARVRRPATGGGPEAAGTAGQRPQALEARIRCA